jgi:hypothetical protein
MLVFIDESGDPSINGKPGTSLQFVVTAVVFPNPVKGELRSRTISQLRDKLRLDPRFEFHFNKCSRKFREEFLAAVGQHKFYYHAFMVNKARLYRDGFK